MALSGSFNGSGSTYETLHFTWSATQDINSNTSTITLNMYLNGSYSISVIGTSNSSETIGGVGSGNLSTPAVSHSSGEVGWSTYLCSWTHTVNHNADGTLTTSVGGTYTINATLSGTYYSSLSGSSNITLDTIPRATQPSVSPTSTDYGTSVTISLPRASTAFTHTLRYDWNSNTGTIATGVATSASWTVPLTFMTYIPNSTSTWGTIYADTYSGSTLIGTKSCTLTTTVPTSVVPTFTSVTASETAVYSGTNLWTTVGSYVQSLSKIQFVINGASGAYSSSLTSTSYKVTFNGTTYTGQSVIANPVNLSGSITATATVTDSRGRSSSQNITITQLAYTVPSITSLTLSRSNSDGSANAIGTYVNVAVTCGVSSLINVTQKNTLTYQIYSRIRGTTSWGTAVYNSTLATGTVTKSGSNVVSTYPADTAYEFQIDVIDKFNTTYSIVVVPVGQVTMSFEKAGIGVGKLWQQGTLDVGGDIYENGTSLTAKYSARSSNGIKITGSSTGNANIAMVEFFESNGTTRKGYVGDASAGNSDIYLEADVSGANINLITNSGNIISFSKHIGNAGFGGIGITPAFTWSGTVPYQGQVTITHSLGYDPIPSFNGTLGNVNINWNVSSSGSSVNVNNWIASGGNAWTGTISFY